MCDYSVCTVLPVIEITQTDAIGRFRKIASVLGTPTELELEITKEGVELLQHPL